MSVLVHVNPLPAAGIGDLVSKNICTKALVLLAVFACATSASAQSVPNESIGTPEGSSSTLSASELAKEITNPVTSLWQLQLQSNNVELESGESLNALYFQPVLPVSLNDRMNLITRPVINLYERVPRLSATGGIEHTTAFGDMIVAQVLSPVGKEPWIFGAGVTWILPTAGSDLTGQGKWQLGPAIGGGYITNKFMIAALLQQWSSIGGDEDRPDTSQMNLLPLIYRYFGKGWSVGYSGSILADFKAPHDEAWTVPIGVSVGKIVMVGKLPMQVQFAYQHFAERPTGGPKWNVQLQVTPVIPRLINKPLFQ